MPKNSYRFAFSGLNLDLPEGWDLSRIKGNFKKGNLDIEDDDGVCLSVWWMLSKDLKKKVQHKAVTVFVGKCECQNFRVEKEGIESFQIYQDGDWQNGLIVYDVIADRTALLVSKVVDIKRFLQIATPLLSDKGLWNYSLYSIRFCAPEDFQLEDCLLAAGCQKFEFMKKNSRLTIWVISMYQRLVKDQSVAQWSMDYVHLNFKKQFSFSKDIKETDTFFEVDGWRKLRWALNLKILLVGNFKTKLIGKQLGNQLYLAFYEYRYSKDEQLISNLILGDLS